MVAGKRFQADESDALRDTGPDRRRADGGTDQDGLDELRAGYAASLRGRWEALGRSWQAARQEEAGALERARLQAHRLAGSAGTFGFAEVSRAAREIEGLLGLRKDESGDDEVSRRLDALFAALPAAAASGAGGREPAWRRESPPAAGTSPVPICIVEDEQDLARALQLQLRTFGFDVVTLGSPALLDAELARRRPAAVIMDVMFEEGDLAGPKAVADSAVMRSGAVPVIFMSGRTDLAARLAAVRAGAAGYLAKPVRIPDLVDRLDRLTGGRVPEPFRALLVGADAAAQGVAQALREGGMAVIAVGDPAEVPGLLGEQGVEVVVIHEPVPGCTGAELGRVIRQVDSRSAILPVLLAGEGASAACGAVEDPLFTRLGGEGLVSGARAAATLYRAQCGLLALDGLTGLANHATLMDQLEREVARARRHGHVLAAAMIDVDHFKQLNDLQGHASGDRVLASLGRFLRQRLRATDFVGRYGGEEFMVLLPETAGDAALRRLDELRREFSDIRHPGAASAFGVTFSAGVATYPEADSAAELSERADQALYAAKAAGRDRVELFSGPARP